MKYKFPYQKVLDIKEKEHEIAKQDFGSSRQRQIELQQRLEEIQTVQDEMYNRYNDVHRKTIWEVLELQEELDHVTQQRKLLTYQSEQLHLEVEEKQKVLVEKTKEVKVWHLWKDKSKQQFIKEQERKEQVMLDEMAVLRHSRKA